MLRRRARRLLADVRRELHDALRETHTPRQVAGSFALGIFITALPTLGIGVLTFFVIASLFEDVSKVAMFAAVVVLNPIAKGGVYGASYWLGSELLGPAGASASTLSPSAGPRIVERLLVGNLLLATGFTVVAYVGGYRLTVAYRRRRGDVGVLERAFERAVQRVPVSIGARSSPANDASVSEEAAVRREAISGEEAVVDGGTAANDEITPGDEPTPNDETNAGDVAVSNRRRPRD